MNYLSEEKKLLNRILSNIELCVEPSQFSSEGKQELLKETIPLITKVYDKIS